MKRLLVCVLSAGMAAGLSGCSGEGSQVKAEAQVMPYELSEKEENLLDAFGMADNSGLMAFQAPETAVTVKVNVYQLRDGESWEIIGNGEMYAEKEGEQKEPLSGTLAMEIRDDYGIDFYINMKGQSSFTAESSEENPEYTVSAKTFLEEPEKIQLNKEIPVAVMVYDNGTRLTSYATGDYFQPEKFEGMDMVRAVTLEFSEKKPQ